MSDPGIEQASRRIRVKELRRVPASDLRAHERNWRRHPPRQRAVLRSVIAEIGFATAIIAHELPDGTLRIIDGHLRADLAGPEEVPVLVLDVTEAEADALLAALDPIAAMASEDQLRLEQILAGLPANLLAVVPQPVDPARLGAKGAPVLAVSPSAADRIHQCPTCDHEWLGGCATD